jgi:hypothetical protein
MWLDEGRVTKYVRVRCLWRWGSRDVLLNRLKGWWM